jgi:hypothetical protein
MSSKRSAVVPSECENVAKNVKKRGKFLNQGLYLRNKISALRHGQKRINAGALQKLSF